MMEATNSLEAKPTRKKSKTSYLNTQAYLAACEIALLNAADEEVMPLLANRGYTKDVIGDKLTELAALKQLVAEQKAKYGEQYAATQAYTEMVARLHAEYMDHLNLARILFNNDTAAQAALGLRGNRMRTESDYGSQALLFYNGALNNATYIMALNGVGVTIHDIQQGKANYEDLILKVAQKARKSGEAQAATVQRDEAIAQFTQWFANFKEIAIIALRKSPQLREKLGWKE